MAGHTIFLIIAGVCSIIVEASLLPHGRARTKDRHDHTESSYACLDLVYDLPICNFVATGDYIAKLGIGEATSKRIRSLDATSDPPRNEAEQVFVSSWREVRENVHPREVTIVYKIKGCRPPRLPFDLPICKERDLVGRLVDVQRIFPFQIFGNLKNEDTDVAPPYVFPELEPGQWHEIMAGHRISENRNNEENGETINGESSPETDARKIPKRKKFERVDGKAARWRRTNRENAESALLKSYEPKTTPELRLLFHRDTSGRHSGDVATFYRFGDIADFARRSSGKEPKKNLWDNGSDEFPYDKAIPYDPKKLIAARPGSEFPYAQAIPYNPEILRALRSGSEFPYARAIPYNPEILRALRPASEFSYAKAIP